MDDGSAMKETGLHADSEVTELLPVTACQLRSSSLQTHTLPHSCCGASS